MSDRPDIEAILPLTPQQAAMLLYAGAAGHRDVGFLLVRFDIVGELDVYRWRAAWSDVVRRHAAMRSTVQALTGQAPMAVVWRAAEMPWEYEDLRGRPAAEQSARIDAYCAESRRRGLPLDRVPVQRLATFAIGERRHHVCWSCHHLLLDGWSSAIVVADALAAYRARHGGESPPPALDYVRYRRHLAAIDDGAALDHWRDRLGDNVRPSLLAGPPESFDGSEVQTVTRELDVPRSGALESLCAREQLTASALVRGLWGLLLAAITSRSQEAGAPGDATTSVSARPIDATYGAVVSGRSAELPGVDTVVGFFSNVVPVRVVLDRRESLLDGLRRLRDEQLGSQPLEHVALADMLAAAAVERTPFDTLLLVQNLPVGATFGDALRVENYSSAVTSVYPLTLVVIPGERWRVHAIFDRRRLDRAWVVELLDAWLALLSEVAGGAERAVDEYATLVSTQPLLRRPVKVAEAGDPNRSLASSLSTRELATTLKVDGFEAPRNRHELVLVDLWQELLGVHPIGVRDNFFDLGGSSIRAVQLFTEIDRRLGRRLPLKTLLERPTIAELALAVANGHVDSDAAAGLRCLVPIRAARPRGDSEPRRLFCIHAGGGHVLFYRELAVELGSGFSVYGLQPVGLDGREPPLRSVEAIAARYLREIRLVQPTGPYSILGYCWGATVAYEMAQQLHAEGGRGTKIVLVDSSAPNRGDARPLFQRLKSTVKRRVPLRRDHLRLLLADRGEKEQIYLRLIQHACEDAFHAYAPRSYADPVLFLQGADSATWDRGYWDEGLIEDWQELVPNLRIEHFDCNHDGFFLPPHVERTAALVIRWLAQGNS